MGAAPPEAPRQDGESAPKAAGVAVPRQSQPCAAYGASAASDAGSTAGSRARAGRGAAALPGRGDPPLDLGWQESEGTATLHSISSMAAYREKSFEELRWESTTPRTTTLRPNHQLSRQRRPSTFYISDVHAITRSDRRSTTTPLVLSHPC
jgi:hypothetical protein